MNNIPEFSVTEISNLTKNILEENFSLIRVKGEISSLKNFKGHLYFSIKDDTNILNAVCWASKVPSIQVQPEDGKEVITEGKISSNSKGSISSYQLQVLFLFLLFFFVKYLLLPLVFGCHTFQTFFLCFLSSIESKHILQII